MIGTNSKSKAHCRFFLLLPVYLLDQSKVKLGEPSLIDSNKSPILSDMLFKNYY